MRLKITRYYDKHSASVGRDGHVNKHTFGADQSGSIWYQFVLWRESRDSTSSDCLWVYIIYIIQQINLKKRP